MITKLYLEQELKIIYAKSLLIVRCCNKLAFVYSQSFSDYSLIKFIVCPFCRIVYYVFRYVLI